MSYRQFVSSCRALLTALRPKVEEAGYRIKKDAWVWEDHCSKGNWEFHGPNGFYLYFSAESAYDARAQGWTVFLQLTDEEVDALAA